MADKLLRRASRVFFKVSLALICGWGTALFWAIHYEDNVQREAIETYLRACDSSTADEIVHKSTFNSLTESRSDRDADGKYDRWTATLRPGSAYEATFVFEDQNRDESPDRISISTKDDKAQYRLNTSTADDEQGFQTMRLPDLKYSAWKDEYTYFDLNLDGRIDVIDVARDAEPSRMRWVVVNGDFIEVSAPEKDDWANIATEYSVRNDSGKEYRATFDYSSGNWSLAPKS